ncbi:Smg-4/UPF3 family protein [Actinidia rufa]|uniref:Smg-4/UPF3 family protein n=1 Tax=Actinidia rufa TaxID=165716 RepID=A0A7J0ES38_9ERIC|nr:Smg-4/UPF3 family protein [Actinidia rufa]
MKGPLDRTKVVVRHLPPTISQSALAEQIDGRFAGRYNSVFFLPGKSRLLYLTFQTRMHLGFGLELYREPRDGCGWLCFPKRQSYARVYLDFKRPDDVIEFAEFFDGHVFVNEKGTQFRTIVEYAPSQRVPKHWSKKDGREGTIFKDPDYMEFLEFLAKPVENLPSAEIQLERREAERAG